MSDNADERVRDVGGAACPDTTKEARECERDRARSLTRAARRWPGAASVVLLSAIAVPSRAANSDYRFKVSDVERVVTSQQEALCPQDAPVMPKPATGQARFTLDKKGALKISEDKKAARVSFAFSDSSANAVARVDVVDGTGRPSRTIGCGSVDATSVYAFPDAGIPDGTMLSVQLFDSGADSTQPLRAERAHVLADIEAAEKAALHGDGELRLFWTDARLAHLDQADGVLDSAIRRGKHLIGRIKDALTAWNCEASPESEFAGRAVCDEMLAVGSAVSNVLVILERARAATIDEPLCREPPPDQQRLCSLRNDKFADALAQLNVSAPLSPADTEAQCERIGKLRWLYTDGALRLVSRASIPIVQRENLIRADYDSSKPPIEAVPTKGKLGFVVAAVPADETVKFATHTGKLIASDLGTIFTTFVPLALKAGIPALGVAADPCATDPNSPICKAKLERERALARLSIRSLVCTDGVEITWPDHKHKSWVSFVFDPAVPPAAKTEARGYVFGPIDKDHVIDVVACKGDVCTGADDDKAVKTRVSLTPDRTGTFSLLLEVSVGVGVFDTDGSGHGFEIMNAPQFQPVFGVEGPDQIYQMQRRVNPTNLVSTSLLLGIRPCDAWLVAIGPSLLVGPSGGAFTQWGLRGGWNFAKSFVLTFGPSARFLQVPTDYKIGDFVSVPRGMNGSVSPPAVQSHYLAEFQFDVGLAIDLASLGSSASDAIKGFGGGK